MALFNRKNEQLLKSVGKILNAQDADIVVVRGSRCEVLFTNTAAQARAGAKDYLDRFPELCDEVSTPPADGETVTLEHRDVEGVLFQVKATPIEWLDEKPAVMLTLLDINDERKMQDKLYNLAYIDALTGVPNRRRFREDFDEVASKISARKLTGLVSIFDLDNFKTINDTYGHNTGDVMLRRLTEHFAQDPAFSGHIYRLGGDEFVLFYTEPFDATRPIELYVEKYMEILQGALLTYTLPNIEKACTLSIGAALFPYHGETYSELLRKADIALYKAKEEGRNRLAFFEDRYDTAQKFKDLYINMQPILDDKGCTFGYEMIDRGNEGEDSDKMNLEGVDRTMDALGLGDIENDSQYFLSYSRQLLNPSVLHNLPKQKFVIQMVDAESPDPALMDGYRQLQKAGYTLALADIHSGTPNPELFQMATYCKFSDGFGDIATKQRMIMQNTGKTFISTSVDSPEEYLGAKRMGYKLFQGYYFEQPTTVKKTKDIDPLKVNYLRLLQLTSTDDYVDFREISSVIASDVALSYKLLRLLNSAALGLRNPVSSIDMAVAYLGEESLKKWIGMLALRGVASDKPLELVRLSLIRAQFAELLAPQFRIKRDARHVFLVGMFSLLHIALEKTPEEMLSDIPVSDEIRLSLLSNDGPHSDLVRLFSSYEYSNWDDVSRFGEENGLSDRVINDAYIAAVRWYSKLNQED